MQLQIIPQWKWKGKGWRNSVWLLIGSSFRVLDFTIMTYTKEGKAAGSGPRMRAPWVSAPGTNLCELLLQLKLKMTPSSPKKLNVIKLVEMGNFFRRACSLGLIMYYLWWQRKRGFLYSYGGSDKKALNWKGRTNNGENGNRWEDVIFKMGLKVHFANCRLEE